MTLQRLPSPNVSDHLSAESYQAPKKSALQLIVITSILAGISGIGYLASTHESRQPVVVAPTLPVPSIRLKPSLAVPGPGQMPHAAIEGFAARPDEAAIFRVDLGGEGYVYVGLENPDGSLTRIYGGRPDDPIIKGSELLSEGRYALAYALEQHKGTDVTFIGLLSSQPYDQRPANIPRDLNRLDATVTRPSGIPESIVAWDRFTIAVAKEVIVPPLE